MTRYEIIRMAREAGALPISYNKSTLQIEYSIFGDQLEHFANLIAAAEREACAKVADAYADNIGPIEYDCGASIAAEIRARGEK